MTRLSSCILDMCDRIDNRNFISYFFTEFINKGIVLDFFYCYTLIVCGRSSKPCKTVEQNVTMLSYIFCFPLFQTFYRKCLLAANTHKAVTPSLSLSSNNSSENSSDVKEPTINDCEKPWSFLPVQVLPDLWRVVYWSSQILSWLVSLHVKLGWV